jgi:dienelactone hydrolase
MSESVRSRSYLRLALVLSVTAACGSDTPTAQGVHSVDGTDDDDTTTDDDGDEDNVDQDDVTAKVDAGSVNKPKDAGAPRIDAGPAVKPDTGVPAGPVRADAGATKADAGPAKDDAGGSAGGGASGTGACCSDGDCLCHGPAPSELTAAAGPFKTATLKLSLGTVYYPTDAEPPFAAVALCAGFTNTGPEMADWGPMYASHGIVTIIADTTGLDDPGTRGMKLLAAIKQLKDESAGTSSPLAGKLSGRYGTSGYSMGGGGTTIASGNDPTLKTSIGLAAWGGTGQKVTVPTLLLCGSSDTVAPCNMSEPVYAAIAEPTPKMMIVIPSTTHFDWFGPRDAGMGISGKYALAFQKVYLEGDERWKPLLLTKPSSGTMTTNIK